MKKSGASQGESASELISKRIAELGDWRGETLSRMRKLIKEADPDVVTFAHIPVTVFSDLASQILWQGGVVGNLKDALLGSLVLFEFLAKWLQPRRCWREVEMRFVRRVSEQESGLHEERDSPLDRLLGLRRDALEDRVQPAQIGLPPPWATRAIF